MEETWGEINGASAFGKDSAAVRIRPADSGRDENFLSYKSPATLTRRFAAPSPSGRGTAFKIVLLPLGEGGAKRRMRVAGLLPPSTDNATPCMVLPQARRYSRPVLQSASSNVRRDVRDGASRLPHRVSSEACRPSSHTSRRSL